jgi:hypothetical protein
MQREPRQRAGKRNQTHKGGEMKAAKEKLNINETMELWQIVENLMLLPEYKRKQIALILIGSTLTDISREEAEIINGCFKKRGE